MGRLAGFRYREIVNRLKELGFEFYRQAAGSHEILKETIMATMHNPPHPGEVLWELHLKETGISVSEAALRLGVSRQAMSAILNRRAGISADMALRLADALGTSAEMWTGMQSAYDLWQAKQKKRPKVKTLLKAA